VTHAGRVSERDGFVERFRVAQGLVDIGELQGRATVTHRGDADDLIHVRLSANPHVNHLDDAAPIGARHHSAECR
jgi:hypothetical protein